PRPQPPSPTRRSSDLGYNPEYQTDYLRLSYQSLITPGSVYDYRFATRELVLRKQQPVLGGYRPEDYEQRREWATAPDGVRVPISDRKSTRLNSSHVKI